MKDAVNPGEGTGDDETAGPNEGTDLDAQSASVILLEARERAQQQLTINHPAMFATWGLVYLVGYGAIWLSVRAQRPYHAPPGLAVTGVFVLAAIGLAVTATIVSRATSGIGGPSDQQRRITYLALAVGYLGVIVMEAALNHAGASQSVIGVFGAAGPDPADWPGICHRLRGPPELELVRAGYLDDRGGGPQRVRRSGCGLGSPSASRRSRIPGGGGVAARRDPLVTEGGLDPVIHAPARLRIMVTLATLPDRDTLSFTRLQDMIGLTPGNLITHLRKLEDAGYVTTLKSGSGVTARTAVSLTRDGRAALDRYTAVLRDLLDSADAERGP